MKPLEEHALAALGEDELDALTSAATWYFKYHGRMIAERADDRSAVALAQREDFHDLHAALWKLGVQVALPEGLPRRG
jgi:hypothetical protein